MSYDSTLKYLLENFPTAFTRWLLATDATPVELLPTELSVEPIRADGLFFLQVADSVLHLEFQTRPQSQPPLTPTNAGLLGTTVSSLQLRS